MTTSTYAKLAHLDFINKKIIELSFKFSIPFVSGRLLTQDEVEVSELGLKFGLATRPSDTEMIIIADNIWDQTEKQGFYKENHPTKERAKNALRSLTYSYVDMDIRRYGIDAKRIKLLN